MTTLLDILGSTLIGGMVLLMVMNFNIFTTQTQVGSTAELQLQRNAKSIAEIINTDFRKIGFKYNGTSITQADSQKFIFYSDINNNNNIRLIEYVLGDTSTASHSINPNDRALFRIIGNDTTIVAPDGITNIRLLYRDENGTLTHTLQDISYVEIGIWLESAYPVNNEYLFTYWQMTINPRNI
jgi:hypothetical protein